MQTTLLLTLCLGFGPLAYATFTSGSSFADDEKTRFDSCAPLVTYEGCSCNDDSGSEEASGSGSASGSWEISGSGSGSGSGSWEASGSGSGSGGEGGNGGGGGEGGSGPWKEGDYCFLLEVFLNYSVVLEAEYKTIFIEWINETQINIVQNTNLTYYQVLVEIWYSLEILFEQYVEIETAIKYTYIQGWGYCFDLQGLAIDIQSDSSCTEISVEEVITLENNDTCPLFTGLEEWASGNDEQTAAIEDLIEEIKVIISGSYSFSVQLVLIYEKFEAFFEAHAEWKLEIFAFQIEGFGSIEAFYDICLTYWRIQYFSVAVGGSASECELLKGLTALYENTSYSISERSEFKQLEVKIETYFNTTVDVQLRIQYFSEQLYQFFILEEWTVEAIYKIELTGYGSIYDLIYAFIYCQNNGISFEGGSTTGAAEATTPSGVETTTALAGDCSTVTGVNVFSSNTTTLLTSIDTAQTSWSSSDVRQFSGYKKRIYNISANTTYTESETFSSIKTIFLNFASSTTTIYQEVQSVVIQDWGTVAQYCQCDA